MRKIITGVLGLALLGALGVGGAVAADTSAPAGDKPAAGQAAGAAPAGAAPAGGDAAAGAAGGACCKAGDTTPPKDLVKNTPKGELHNPYNDQIEATAAAGHKLYMGLSCNGCHGGGGGGGMCPPLTNPVWIYGKDDDTLFRLVTIGTDGLKAEGYARKGSENVVGPMPPFGDLMKTSDDLWKIIAWIRSKNPSSVTSPPAPPQ